MPISFHHVAAITRDADASAEWYQRIFGLRRNWTLRTFSPLTVERLPGLTRIDELTGIGFRIHLMEVASTGAARDTSSFAVFQHACIAVDSADELRRIRNAASTPAQEVPPTEIIVDDDGVESFYLRDPDALEWEITWVPTCTAGR